MGVIWAGSSWGSKLIVVDSFLYTSILQVNTWDPWAVAAIARHGNWEMALDHSNHIWSICGEVRQNLKEGKTWLLLE